MDQEQKYKIEDLIEQIEWSDKMILFHVDNPSRLMPEQYEYRKKLLFNELIEELMKIEDIPNYNFKLIYLAIHKYYPELIQTVPDKENNNVKINQQFKELKELEAVLAA